MANVKKYLITALTLGAIAMCAGALIGATDLITRDRIAENETKKINASFVEIYGEGTTGTENESFNYNEYTYLKSQYEIFSSDGASIGMAYRTLGSNAYGKISLIVGFVNGSGYRYVYYGISVVINEQSFATTLEDNFLIPVQNGDREVDDVKCGATYGATLVKNMINEAKEAAKQERKVWREKKVSPKRTF